MNEYASPTVADVAGAPLMLGGEFVATTVIENGDRLDVATPSDDEITMLG